MRTLIRNLGLLLLAGIVAIPEAAEAQATARPRGDVAANLGWLYIDTGVERAGNRTPRDNTLYGGVTAGWYWTDHFKTEIEAGGGSEG